MSEASPGANVVGSSAPVRNLLYFQIGCLLLGVAAVSLLIVVGWLPNFLSFLDVTPTFLRYAAELLGFYGLVFLLVGVIGSPASPRDYYGGAALIALAIFALEASHDLPGRRGFAFGPGTAPFMFAIVLGLLGIGVSATGLTVKGPGIDRFYFRGPFFISLSVVVFAWMVRPLGLVIASFLSILACAGATPESRVVETLVWGAVLTAFCCLLFPVALNLPLQLWPNSWDPIAIFKSLLSFR
jgi:putative tricarboxylic transport membrane protein